MGASIESYVDDLFKYFGLYETRYSDFQPEAFFQTYNGIYAVFQALPRQRDKAVEVDQYFLEKIKQTPLTSSDLRQLTIQVLITFFESEADTDGQSNRAYLYCRELRAAKRDTTFFEENLIPLLMAEGSLNENPNLRSFFLKEISRYVNTFGRGVQADLSPEAFAAMPDPLKILELSRRRLALGKELLKDRNSLEFHLQRVGALEKLSEKSNTCDHFLNQWNYLIKTSFWANVKRSLSAVWGKFKGLFSSFRFFRLALVQRNPAYLFYSLIIILFILLAIYVPMKWIGYANEKLDDFNERAIKTQNEISK